MNGNHITSFQAVDFALGGLLAECFGSLSPESGPKAIRRFIERPANEKIFFVQNGNVQATLRKLAGHEDEPGKKGCRPDLPVVMYYREQGIAADPNQHIQVAETTRFVGEEMVMGMDKAMRITTMPVTLTYSLLFLAWDRASIEHMALAWWAYIAPLYRKHSRFMVPYTLDGEKFEVGASVSAPREVLTSDESVGEDDLRLWGSRTMCEVNTQAVAGGKLEIPDCLRFSGQWQVME